jgi:hypothetical protein
MSADDIGAGAMRVVMRVVILRVSEDVLAPMAAASFSKRAPNISHENWNQRIVYNGYMMVGRAEEQKAKAVRQGKSSNVWI